MRAWGVWDSDNSVDTKTTQTVDRLNALAHVQKGKSGQEDRFCGFSLATHVRRTRALCQVANFDVSGIVQSPIELHANPLACPHCPLGNPEACRLMIHSG
jgi:hypothetical protein